MVADHQGGWHQGGMIQRHQEPVAHALPWRFEGSPPSSTGVSAAQVFIRGH
jgi:hypothetical protein